MSYPINLDVENKICVVVGGGRVALRKVRALLDAKANVIVIAPELCDGFPSVQPMKELPSTVECPAGLLQLGIRNAELGINPAGLFLPTRPPSKKPLEHESTPTAGTLKVAPLEPKEPAQPSEAPSGTLKAVLSTVETNPAGLFRPTRPPSKKPLGHGYRRSQVAPLEPSAQPSATAPVDPLKVAPLEPSAQPSATASVEPLKVAPLEPKESAQLSAAPVFTLHNDFIWLKRKYEVGCIPRGVLLIAATNDPEINRQAAIEATEKNMLVNAVDGSNDVGLQFENPSTIRRGELLLTISTGGKSPALSKFIRQRLEKIFDDNFARQLDTIEQMRDEIKNAINDPDERITFWQQLLNEKNFSPTVDSEELGVKIRNALNSYRAQPQHRTD